MTIDNRKKGADGKFIQKFDQPLSRTSLSIRLEPEKEAQLKAIADLRGLNWRDIAREAIDEYLEKIAEKLSTSTQDSHDFME